MAVIKNKDGSLTVGILNDKSPKKKIEAKGSDKKQSPKAKEEK